MQNFVSVILKTKELEENARNKILKKFSHEHLLEDYLNLFASICKRSNNEDKQTI